MEHPCNKESAADRVLGLALVVCSVLLANTALGVVGEQSEEIGWLSAAQKEGLSEKDIKVLQENRILIADQTYKQVFEAYLKGTVPFFITSDSLLNAYHVLYEESVLRLENANAGKLPEILRTIHDNLSTVGEKWKASPVLAAAAQKRAGIIIGVGLRLLDDSYRTGDKELDAIIEREVKKVVEAKAREMPAWLGKADSTFLGLDYSRYKPRGFYTNSERLKRYFRSVAWLQSIPFRVSKDEELVAVLMLGSCVPRSRFTGHIAKTKKYEVFFRGYRMFIGSGDDWDLLDAGDAARDVSGHDLSSGVLAGLKQRLIKKAMLDGKGPQINDQLRFAPLDPNATAEANFRIISAYRTPDGILFQRTTDLRRFRRDFPNGLEVCTALGSRFAREKLTYKDKEKLLKTIDEAKALFSGNSLYFCYLRCLASLLDEVEKDAPGFMKGEPWQAKSCNTALGGWAQLRHTWALQAKQTVHYAGLTMPPKGLVEPEPEFYSRMALLAQRTQAILEQAHLFDMDYNDTAVMLMKLADLLERAGTRKNLNKEIDEVGEEKFKDFEAAFMIMHHFVDRDDRENLRKPARRIREIAKDLRKGKLPQDSRVRRVLEEFQVDIKALWESLGEISRRLEMLAHKELRGKDWNRQDELFIRDYGTRIAKIMLYGGNSYLSPNDDAPRVVDVYANPYSVVPEHYLHVGVARPRAMYVLYPWRGKQILCKGAVMPYYEFGYTDRLTDAEWKKLLDSEQRPCLPEWVTPILCLGAGN